MILMVLIAHRNLMLAYSTWLTTLPTFFFSIIILVILTNDFKTIYLNFSMSFLYVMFKNIWFIISAVLIFNGFW